MSLQRWLKLNGSRLWKTRWQALAAWLLLVLMGYWVIFSDPFGIGTASDAASEKLVYRLTSGWYDTSAGQDNIVVIVFNDRSIDNLYPGFMQANDWPLSYLDQVSLLTTIMAQRPAALFYDVMWMKQRSMDPSFDRAITRLKMSQEITGVPLYLAAGTTENLASNPILPQLKGSAIGVINAWEDAGGTYPLIQQDHPSAALALYQQYCQQHGCQPHVADFQAPMSVRWSNYAAPPPEHRQGQCQSAPQNVAESLLNMMGELLSSGLNQDWMDSEELPLCLPHQVLYMDEVFAMARDGNEQVRQQLQHLLADKLVLVGGQIEGIYDYAQSPVHGTIPGVMFHAMALDNLLTMEQNYLRETDWGVWWIWGSWCVFALFLVLIHRPALAQRIEKSWLNYYWLSGVSYAVVIITLSMWWWHLSPSGWIALLALGWIGQRVLDALNEYFADLTQQQAHQETLNDL